MKCACSDDSRLKLVFPCSGGSDLGELTDKVGRKLTKDDLGKMYCLAGIGGKVSGIIKTTESADVILAIDGCPLHCAKKTLENAGFTNIKHIVLTDLGFKKGETEITEENINKVIILATEKLKECDSE